MKKFINSMYKFRCLSFCIYFKYIVFTLLVIILFISVILGLSDLFFFFVEPILIEEPLDIYFQLKVQQKMLVSEIGFLEARLDGLYQHVSFTDLMSNSDLYYSNLFDIWRSETKLNILKESLSGVQNKLNILLSESGESTVDLTAYVFAVSVFAISCVYIIIKFL